MNDLKDITLFLVNIIQIFFKSMVNFIKLLKNLSKFLIYFATATLEAVEIVKQLLYSDFTVCGFC